MLAIAVGMVALVALMDAPPGYERLNAGLENAPRGEFPAPLAMRLTADEVQMLAERLGPPSHVGGSADEGPRAAYVFGRADRPTIGFAIWLSADGTATTGGWHVEPFIPRGRELRQQWLAPGIVSWLDAVTALE